MTPATVRRVGVMGGMFDPVHRGHLAAAIAALDALDLEELRLIPVSSPNHRDPASADAPHRVAMLQLAAQEDSRLLVDEREIKRPGISYTVDTLLSLHQDFSGAQFVLVLGEDAFRGLPGWHRWQELFQLCHICVVNRPGDAEEAAQLPPALQTELGARQTRNPADLRAEACGRIFLLQKEGLAVASSDLRGQLQAGLRPVALPEAVNSYIQQHDLYT